MTPVARAQTQTGLNRPIQDTRCIDHLGRIVLPMSLRNMLHLDSGAPVDISYDGSKITLMPVKTSCMFCGSNEDLITVDGKSICKACLHKAKVAADGC